MSYRLANRVIFQTKGAAQYFIKRGVRSFTIIPNPVIQPKGPPVRNTKPTILGVGRFTRKKGFDLLIEAFASIADQHPDWGLVIHGDGPLRMELEYMISNASFRERVSLPGTTRDLTKAFSEAGLFVLPSRNEGFPNALCEAMAHGLPVIAMSCPFGPGEIISQEIDGLLVPNGNVDSLSQAMTRLISDTNLRNALGEKAAEITNRFSLQSILDHWESVLKEEVAQR